MTLIAPPVAAAQAVSSEQCARELDHRSPTFRLRALLDEGSMQLITPDDESGMVAATGTVQGSRVVAFCSDAGVLGGAMGVQGCGSWWRRTSVLAGTGCRSSGSGTPVALGSPRACCRCMRSAGSSTP